MRKISFTLRSAEGDLFIDREDIISEMVKTLSDPHLDMGFALYGPRRIGKSSILLEVKRLLKKKPDIVPVYFNLWSLDEGTVSEINRELTLEVLRAYKSRLKLGYVIGELRGLSRNVLRTLLKNTKIEMRLLESIEVLITYDEEEKQDPGSIKLVMELVENIAKKTNTRCVLILDEFPTITELKCGTKIGEGIIRVMRTVHERQKNTVLCVAGSSRSTMDSAVLSPTSPFYRQFIVKEVKPLEKKYVVELITKNIDCEITKEALDSIYDFTNGIPYYVQFIGRHLYMFRKPHITKKDVEEIIEDFLREEGNLLLKRDFESLPPMEKVIVKTMAVENIKKPSKIAKIRREHVSNIYVFVDKLMEKGVLERKERGEYVFTDPIFEKWLKRK